MIRIKKHYLLDNAIAFIQDLISQLESKVSLSEDRCAELSMEVDELSAHVKVNVCLGPRTIKISLDFFKLPKPASNLVKISGNVGDIRCLHRRFSYFC